MGRRAREEGKGKGGKGREREHGCERAGEKGHAGGELSAFAGLDAAGNALPGMWRCSCRVDLGHTRSPAWAHLCPRKMEGQTERLAPPNTRIPQLRCAVIMKAVVEVGVFLSPR